MNRMVASISLAVAFAAGCGVSYLMRPAQAAVEMITPQVFHTSEMNGDAIGPAGSSGLRSKMLVAADGATVSIQDGNTAKHLHTNANEMQFILEGTGTMWLGDKEVRLKPGDLIVIPKGTAHGGTKPDGRTFKAIAIKTPPQAAGDTTPLN